MTKTTYYAQKDLTIEGKQIAAGDELGTLEASIPVERLLAGLRNGAVSAEKPAEKHSDKNAEKPVDRKPAK